MIDDSSARARLRFGPARGRAISFLFEGRRVDAFEGESVACALFAAGFRTLRSSPREGTPRGMFCLMGSCQECVVRVDGRRTTACQEPVREGMDVREGTIRHAP
jgi:D-hydroxyproline dehydrogenase subunit gamma